MYIINKLLTYFFNNLSTKTDPESPMRQRIENMMDMEDDYQQKLIQEWKEEKKKENEEGTEEKNSKQNKSKKIKNKSIKKNKKSKQISVDSSSQSMNDESEQTPLDAHRRKKKRIKSKNAVKLQKKSKTKTNNKSVTKTRKKLQFMKQDKEERIAKLLWEMNKQGMGDSDLFGGDVDMNVVQELYNGFNREEQS